jgi:hypothetical protein
MNRGRLSRALTLPQRLPPKLAAATSRPRVECGPAGLAPCLSFSALQHIRSDGRLFSLPHSEASSSFCPRRRRSRPQGLATLSTASAPSNLGSLFQLPTLLGFALQSFLPSSRSTEPFNPVSPLSRFPVKPVQASQRRPSDLLPKRKPDPLHALRRVSSERGPLLSWAFGPLRLSPSETRSENSLFASDRLALSQP